MPSKISRPVGIRMKSDELDILDTMVELGGFSSRGECLRMFMRPVFDMAKTAIETKSVMKAGFVRLQAEQDLMKHIERMSKHADVQTELFGDLPEVQPQPA